MDREIRRALISVYNKVGLMPVVRQLQRLDVMIFSTGGTCDYLRSLGVEVQAVEQLTDYPSILGGRVKTLHPKVFGGILARRDNPYDQQQLLQYNIPLFDLVIVDLYPFEETFKSGATDEAIIEKIDIGGISLLRAAAKNFTDIVIIPAQEFYTQLLCILEDSNGQTTLDQRRILAMHAFNVSSHYDTSIYHYFNRNNIADVLKISEPLSISLRYGENPHQKGRFFGNLDSVFAQLHGKELSYNNLVDLDSAIALVSEFNEPTAAIIKHTNACGIATRNTLLQAWVHALACDPISAFGGVIVLNRAVDEQTATEINQLFFEIIFAPHYCDEALKILKSRKNRIILQQKSIDFQSVQYRTVLNGILWQDKDAYHENASELKVVTNRNPEPDEVENLIWANRVVKHTKSNAIVLAKSLQLCGIGTGQTSRVDATKQAVGKAITFGFDLSGAVLASDAFFPFSDSVELAHHAGITAVIQPGGSLRDNETIEFCNAHNMSMVFTGHRHFRH